MIKKYGKNIIIYILPGMFMWHRDMVHTRRKNVEGRKEKKKKEKKTCLCM